MRNRRTDWQPEAIPFVYPHNLREEAGDVPAKPGVYFFYGESDSMPLYIGKSVNLRARLLSHFRNTDEAKLLRQTRYIRYQQTAGEIGALLLEAQLIKQLKPLFNKRLRKTRLLHTLKLTDQGVSIISLSGQEMDTADDIYGLFKNRYTALGALKEIADQHALCYGLLGIEKIPGGAHVFVMLCVNVPGPVAE